MNGISGLAYNIALYGTNNANVHQGYVVALVMTACALDFFIVPFFVAQLFRAVKIFYKRHFKE